MATIMAMAPPSYPPAAVVAGVPAQLHLLLASDRRTVSLVRAVRSAGGRILGHEDPQDVIETLSDFLPNLVLVDGLSLAASALAGPLGQRAAIAAFAAHPTAEQVVDLTRLGAVDVLDASLSDDRIALRLLDTAARIAELQLAMRSAERQVGAVATLSARERDVLGHLALGRRTKEIARLLELSPRTVEMHCARLRRRLGVGSLHEAVGLWVRAQPD